MILPPAMLTDSRSPAILAVVPLFAVFADTRPTAVLALMPLLAVLTDTSSLAVLAFIPLLAMNNAIVYPSFAAAMLT
jgi:hypothetical protein